MSACECTHFHFHLKCLHVEVLKVLKIGNDHKSTTLAETSGEFLEIENPNKLAFLCEALALIETSILSLFTRHSSSANSPFNGDSHLFTNVCCFGDCFGNQ